MSILANDKALLDVQSLIVHAKLPYMFMKETKTSKIRFKQKIGIIKMFYALYISFPESEKLIFIRKSRLSISNLFKLQSDLTRCYMGNAIVRLEMVTIILRN